MAGISTSKLTAQLAAAALAALSTMFLPAAARSEAPCSLRLSTLAAVSGSPDDLSVHRGRVLVSAVDGGTVSAIGSGHVHLLARGLSAPEGIVDEGSAIVVAEQGRNRLVRIETGSHRRTVLLRLVNTTSQEGVDGIASGPHGSIIIPDSPNGTLLRLGRGGRLTVLARGMVRPTGAVRYGGGYAVADEYGHAVWLVAGGRRALLGHFSTPDDVAVFHGVLLAVTLGDHALWEVAPVRKRLIGSFMQPQGLAVRGTDVLVADSDRGEVDVLSGVQGCLR